MSTAVPTPPSQPSAASWKALGSTAEVRVADPAALGAAVELVERELARFDHACSRFREDSELSRVNARAGRPVEVDALLLDALELALRGARLTDGALDPTLGLSLEQAGYDRDWDLLAESEDEEAPAARQGPGAPSERSRPRRLIARRRGGWRQIELDHSARRVRIPAGTKLDLGATAKALAADRAAAGVHRRLGCGTIVALGGDVAAAGTPPDGGWRVHVTDDHRAGAGSPGQGLTIEAGGLATSSTVARRWRQEGESRHHIIDPVSGRPANTRWRTVSVAAADCTDANIASTGALLRDGDAPAWLGKLGLPARLVTGDGRVLRVGGWPEQGEALPALEGRHG
jgi:FAD:protein FMN transferase